MKILFAESKDRTDIFRKIFDTDIYNLITKKLVERQKEYKDNLKDLKNSFVTNYSNIIWKENPSEFSNISSKEINRIDIEDILKLLEQEIEDNKEQYNLLNEKLEKSEKELKKIDEQIKNQIEENNNIDKYKNLLEEKINLDNKKDYIKSQKDYLEKNQKILSAVLPKEEKVLSLKNEVNKLENDIINFNKNIESYTQKDKLNKEKEKKLLKLKKLLIDYQKLFDGSNSLKMLQAKISELKQIENTKNEAIKEYENISKIFKELNNKYINEEDRFFKEQVGIIAEKLEEGKPCPVCGSSVHPNIAQKSDCVLSKESLDELKKECEKKLVENNEIKNKITELTSKYEVMLSNLEEYSNEKINIKKYSLIIEKKYNESIKKTQRTELECENIIFEICGKKIKLESFDYEGFKNDFEKNQNLDKEELIRIKALQKEFISQNKLKNKELEKAKNEYERAYIKLGFETEKDYKEKTCNEIKLKQITKEIDNYKTAVAENKIMICELEKKVKKKEKKDIEADKAIVLELQKNLALIKKELMENKGILDNNKRMNSLLKNTSKELLEKIDDFVIVDELARTASGMILGKRRIEFEQYVQSAYFDMIIIEANKRLSKMTDKRYYLIRKEVAEKASDRIGLDLEVIDNYNGKRRDVKSLSGGEAFKAALSLALGLSDIIQSYSGGVVIDTLFIDEGFGSLDSESRDQAINTLSSLIEGNKLIGIISHVTELQDRIDKKIVVTKTTSGSIIG